MPRPRNTRIAITVTILFGSTLMGQRHETEHTFRYDPSSPGPKASLKDVAWLEGAWQGTAFGGISEEIWSESLAGSMMGVYRSVENGTVKFYEIDTILEVNGSLEMRIKHFNPDLAGWEEKTEVRKFPLIRISNEEICFDGMTYKRSGEDSMIVFLAVGTKEKGVREVVFEYTRRSVSR